MAGVDTIVRLIGAVLAVFIIIVVLGFGIQVIDPIYTNVIDPAALSARGWGTPHTTVYFFFGLAIVGLLVVIIVWLLVAEARNDVRQGLQRRGPF